MRQVIVSTSLDPESKSALLAAALEERSRQAGHDTELIDLRQHELPFCDGHSPSPLPVVQEIRSQLEAADAIAVATPVYSYDVSGAARNLLALTGKVWNDKVVGLLGAAGGQRSYMSLLGFANSLMLDFRCLIVPRFVYADSSAFEGERIIDGVVLDRICRLAVDLERVGTAMADSLEPTVLA